MNYDSSPTHGQGVGDGFLYYDTKRINQRYILFLRRYLIKSTMIDNKKKF
jgi:hypothetical protein